VAKRTGRQRALLGLTSFLAIFSLAAAGAIGWVYTQASSVPRVDVSASLAPPVAPGDPLNILLVGIDSGAGLNADNPVLTGRGATLNTDTIMILRVDPKNQQAALMSLPRDLWVKYAGGGEGRINAALANGGPEKLIDTINSAFGIPINHYAMVDFNGFGQLVDTVDGVPIYFNYPARDENTGLYQFNAGCQVLDSEQALAYVRSRYYQIRKPNSGWQFDPSSDYGRIARQQQFIKAALKKAVSKGVRNPFTLKEYVDIAQKNVILDTQLSVQELLDLAQQFRLFDPDQLVTMTLTTYGVNRGGASTLDLNMAASAPVLDVFRGVIPIPEPASTETPASTTSTTVPSSSTTQRQSPTTTQRSATTTTQANPFLPNLSTTTTISDFVPNIPPGETCG